MLVARDFGRLPVAAEAPRPPGLLPTLLAPASILYAAGWLGYESVYRLGWKRAYRPSVPTICVGNLLVGGLGKTPSTLFLAGTLREMGADVVLGMSGYGTPAAKGASLAPPGELDAHTFGDEPAMVRLLDPTIQMVIGRDRVAAAKIVEDRFPESVLLMDDGFQHLRIRPTTTLVLDDPTASRLCLPAGRYREPRFTGLRRADRVAPWDFALVRSPMRSVFDEPAEGSAVGLVCALGQPRRFVDEVARRFEIGSKIIMRDHDSLSDAGLLANLRPGQWIATTAKDWVKLRNRPDQDKFRWCVWTYEVELEPKEAVREWLSNALT